MEISRRAIVLASGPGEFSGKPRPALVIQSDLFNAGHGSVTLLPITSVITGNALFRVVLPPNRETGLREESEVQADKARSLRRHRVVKVIGKISPTVMERVDDALRRWLGL